MEEIRFTCQEVADILGCTKQTICNWRDNGKIPTHEESYHVNGKSNRYITDTDLLLYFNQEQLKIQACIRNLNAARKTKKRLRKLGLYIFVQYSSPIMVKHSCFERRIL